MVVWQFCFVVFESKDQAYSYLYEFLSTLKRLQLKNISIHLLHHLENATDCKIVTWFNGALTIVSKEFSPFLGDEVSQFVRSAKQLVPNPTYSGFVVYSHGNGWFYRHNEKVQAYSTLLKGLKAYKWDLFLLESCYCSTLEIAYEVKDNVHYLLTSECGRSSFPTFTLESFSICDTCDAKTMAIHLADMYIDRCNMVPPDDKTILPTVGDIVLLDLTQFNQYLKWLTQYQILTRLPIDNYKYAKLKPQKQNYNRNYDIYTAIIPSLSFQQKQDFTNLHKNLVVYYKQTENLQSKPYSNRFTGLAWCPVPWDSRHGWTYKYMKCYPLTDVLLYKGTLLSELREEEI